jgi:putative tricarboxylic transport membrane protein
MAIYGCGGYGNRAGRNVVPTGLDKIAISPMRRPDRIWPLLFENQGRLVYGLFGAMLMANFVNLWVGQVGLRLWVRVMAAPESVIFAAAMLMCIAGVGIAAGGLFGVMVMLVFAALGYLMSSFGYPLVIVIIALFLGPRLEVSIAQSLALTRGDPAALIDHPVAIALLLLSVVSVVYLMRRTRQLDG